MRATEAMIAYTPAYYNDGPKAATRGQVKIGPLLNTARGDNDWSRPYAFTIGAAELARRKYLTHQSLAQVFIDFHTIVVRDGIDPQVAHQAFLAIDEYRRAISPDIPGAESSAD